MVVNTPDGLEQGFTLPSRPAANPHRQPLRLRMQVGGDLTPVVDETGLQLTLQTADGEPVVTYDHLQVCDADGRRLPARMHTSGGQQVQLEMDDARYPLTIDPTFAQQAYLASE